MLIASSAFYVSDSLTALSFPSISEAYMDNPVSKPARASRQGQGSMPYLTGICFVTTIGGFLFGYDTAIIAGCNSFLESHFQLSKAGLGWVAASALLGTIVGTFMAGFVADRWGRKAALILASLLLILSATGSMLVPVFLSKPLGFAWIQAGQEAAGNWLVCFRMIGGVGVGITYAVSPLYIAELVPPHVRGRLVSIYQLSITLGILFAFVGDYLVLHFAGDAAGVVTQDPGGFWHWAFVTELWRGMFGTEIPVACIFFILLLFVPETPRWLVGQSRNDDAKKILIRLNGNQEAKRALEEIHDVLEQQQGSFRELLAPHLRVPLCIGILLPMFSHLSGIAAIMYFAPNILNEAMQNTEGSFLGAALVGVINTAFTFVAIWKVDRFGRRGLLITGVTGACLSLGGVGLLFYLGSKWVLIPLLFYVACFAFSYGPVCWIIISEIFPMRIRGRAAALGAFSLSVTSFVITQSNPILFERISPAGTFFLYAVLTAVAIWFIWRFVPETKGRTLEEIEKRWLKKKS